MQQHPTPPELSTGQAAVLRVLDRQATGRPSPACAHGRRYLTASEIGGAAGMTYGAVAHALVTMARRDLVVSSTGPTGNLPLAWTHTGLGAAALSAAPATLLDAGGA